MSSSENPKDTETESSYNIFAAVIILGWVKLLLLFFVIIIPFILKPTQQESLSPLLHQPAL